MKVRIEQAEFAEAIGWATRLIGSRPRLAILSGVMLTAKDGRLTCAAHDLEVAGDIAVPAQIATAGEALLPGRLLASVAAKLPDAPVDLTLEGEEVTIDCGRAHFTLRTMRADDYPAPLRRVDDATTGTIKADAFSRMITQVARAAGTDDTRPMLMGIKFHASDGKLTAAATDSYRLAVRTIPWAQPIEGDALVPARALAEAGRAASEAGAEVAMAFEDGQISIQLGERRMTSREIEAAFPDYTKLLPDSFETAVIVERAALVDSLQRVSVVSAGQPASPLSLIVEDGGIELRAGGQEGAASEAMPAEVSGPGLEIAFNPTYLAAGLDATGSERIRIELRDGLKPAVLRPQPPADSDEPAEDFLYLLMPMRVNQ